MQSDTEGCSISPGSGSRRLEILDDTLVYYIPHGNHFSGRVKGVQLAIAEAAENAVHLVKPEDSLGIAMARQ